MNSFQHKNSGLWTTFVTAVLLLFFFFGRSLTHLNTTYFTPGGDGLQAYYTAIYHVKYDTTYWRTQCMNYPNGEQVFFTGCAPLITNTIKAISNVVDISDYTVGILNFVMLSSIVFCTLFLYLIFRRLKIPDWIAITSSLFIAFASPQLARLTGHFALTYQFAIPAFIYLLMRFYDQPNWKNTIFISLLTLMMAGTQFYFFGFFMLIAGFFWLYFVIHEYLNVKHVSKVILFSGIHFFVQMVLPFLLIQLLIKNIDPVTDRTAEPYGFFVYVSKFSSIFYPFGRWYDISFIRNIIKPNTEVEWEGVSFVGLLSLALIFMIILQTIRALFRMEWKKIIFPFDDGSMNMLWHASLAAVLVACAIPFSVFDRFIYYNIGYFKQLRGIGRFAWIAYYAFNIIAVWWFAEKMKSRSWLKFVFVFFLFVMGIEAYQTSSQTGLVIQNAIPELDQQTNHPDYTWIKTINKNDYQAIIPLPYFHIGSENIWIDPQGTETMRNAYLSSALSGMPLVSVLLNRNSLSDMFDHIRIVQEPYVRPKFIDQVNNKPYLLVVDKSALLNPSEEEMLRHAHVISETEKLLIAAVPVSYFSERIIENRKKIISTYSEAKYYSFGTVFSSDSIHDFVMKDFSDHPAQFDSPLLSGKIRMYPRIFDDTLPLLVDSTRYLFSCWIKNFSQDLIPRTTIEIVLLEGDEWKQSDYIGAGSCLVTTNETGEGLIEFPVNVKRGQRLMVTFINELIHPAVEISWHNVMIRPEGNNLYSFYKENMMYNNRYFNVSSTIPEN